MTPENSQVVQMVKGISTKPKAAQGQIQVIIHCLLVVLPLWPVINF
jgi:hypothetical protein